MTIIRRTFGLALLLLMALPWGGDAAAQDLKVGYTDPELIIVNMPEYRQIRQQLQQEYTQGQEALQSLYLDFQEQLEKYQKQQALLSEQRRAEREQELAGLQAEIQQAAAQKDQELGTREGELMQPLIAKVEAAINEVAQAQGIDIVLRAPSILYVNEDRIIDITTDVASRLGLEVDETAAN